VVPYPLLTNDMHHEVELVVALKSGGMNIKPEKANDHIWGYGVGIDLTRRDLQIASRDVKRPWEVGKAFDGSAPCGALVPASRIGHPAKGRIALKVNGTVKQDGDLNQMIWNVPETIWKLSEMVELAAGDIIMTGTPAGVGPLVSGDKVECEIEGVGSLRISIGPRAGSYDRMSSQGRPCPRGRPFLFGGPDSFTKILRTSATPASRLRATS
jgi:fumarylpyruvate hydrolase